MGDFMDFVTVHLMILSRNITYRDSTSPINTSSNPRDTHSQIQKNYSLSSAVSGFFCGFLCHLPRVECLPVFVFGCRVKMAAATASVRVWNRLHMILNTWQQLEREKARDQKKVLFFFKWERKEKQRVHPGSPSPPFFFFMFSHFSFLFVFPGFGAQSCECRDGSSPLMSVQLSNTQTEMFAARPLSSSQQNACAYLTEPSERRTVEEEIKNMLIYMRRNLF